MSFFDDHMRTKLPRLAAEMSRVVVRELVAAAPIKTGELRRSIRTFTRYSLSQLVVEVEASADQANYTEFGTAPHIIRPRRAGGLLVFYWPKVGRVVRLPKVNHPGTKPMRWFSRTLFHADAMFQEAWNRTL